MRGAFFGGVGGVTTGGGGAGFFFTMARGARTMGDLWLWFTGMLA